MDDSLKARIRVKLLRQISEDGGRPVSQAETDDPRLLAVAADLAALDDAADDDPVIEQLAARYWVP